MVAGGLTMIWFAFIKQLQHHHLFRKDNGACSGQGRLRPDSSPPFGRQGSSRSSPIFRRCFRLCCRGLTGGLNLPLGLQPIFQIPAFLTALRLPELPRQIGDAFMSQSLLLFICCIHNQYCLCCLFFGLLVCAAILRRQRFCWPGNPFCAPVCAS